MSVNPTPRVESKEAIKQAAPQMWVDRRLPMSNKKLTVKWDHRGGLPRKKSHSNHLVAQKKEMRCLVYTAIQGHTLGPHGEGGGKSGK